MTRYARLILNRNFILGLSMGIGLCIGVHLLIQKPASKFDQVLGYVEKYYINKVDKADLEALTEAAIYKVAKQLDPYTSYIDAKQSERNQSYLEGNFEGIGIHFTILKDTIYVLNSVPQGPAHDAGIQPGDKILKIDDQEYRDKKLDLNEIIDHIRGPKGTSIKLSIQRGDQLFDIKVARDKIPVQSIGASYMINLDTAYIKLSRFALSTHAEFMTKINQLRDQGMQKLVLDLRNNTGGYVTSALNIAEEMLEPGKLMLYTKGRYKGFNKEYYAKGKNRLKKVPIIILLNEYTASASELLAGILQDHDRALIVGRRSFGKGLIQWPIQFKDKSILNLTIEQYFLPSGRAIQKDYNKRIDYQLELANRYKNGEYFSLDSIKFNPELAAKTTAGRTVYGGGGIMPDCFIPLDTTDYNDYIHELAGRYMLEQYAIEYVRFNKERLTAMGLEDYAQHFQVSQGMLTQLMKDAEKLGIKKPNNNDGVQKNIKHWIKADIAKVLWHEQGFYRVYNTTDKMFLVSLELFNQAEALLNNDIQSLAEQARKN